jgi:hypothetical protein
MKILMLIFIIIGIIVLLVYLKIRRVNRKYKKMITNKYKNLFNSVKRESDYFKN